MKTKKDNLSSLLHSYWKEETNTYLDYDKWYKNNLWFHGVSIDIKYIPKLRKFIEEQIKNAINSERRRVRRLKKHDKS